MDALNNQGYQIAIKNLIQIADKGITIRQCFDSTYLPTDKINKCMLLILHSDLNFIVRDEEKILSSVLFHIREIVLKNVALGRANQQQILEKIDSILKKITIKTFGDIGEIITNYVKVLSTPDLNEIKEEREFEIMRHALQPRDICCPPSPRVFTTKAYRLVEFTAEDDKTNEKNTWPKFIDYYKHSSRYNYGR